MAQGDELLELGSRDLFDPRPPPVERPAGSPRRKEAETVDDCTSRVVSAAQRARVNAAGIADHVGNQNMLPVLVGRDCKN